MQASAGLLEGVVLLSPKVFGDQRGWFIETYNHRVLREFGIHATFVQDNHSYSAKRGTLRGLHLQRAPLSQAKLIRCIRGSILDVVVDLRPNSPTYRQWMQENLSEENKKQIFIPKGFAHGFVTLTDHVEIQYKVDAYYSPEHELAIRYDDPELGIDWGVESPTLSGKDSQAPFLHELPTNLWSNHE